MDRIASAHLEIKTVESLLAAMRKGNTQPLEIKIGDFATPVRLLSAHEEAIIAVKAAAAATKANPSGHKREMFEAQATMKAILFAACTIDGTPTIALHFFDALTAAELGNLFDQYTTLNNSINPNFEDMKPVEIEAIIDDIKKKKRAAKDFYTYQLAGIGKWFLQALPVTSPTDSEPGS